MTPDLTNALHRVRVMAIRTRAMQADTVVKLLRHLTSHQVYQHHHIVLRLINRALPHTTLLLVNMERRNIHPHPVSMPQHRILRPLARQEDTKIPLIIARRPVHSIKTRIMVVPHHRATLVMDIVQLPKQMLIVSNPFS